MAYAAQLLNNALTECLKRGRVNLLCHGHARDLFLNSQGRRDAARADRAAWAVQRRLAARSARAASRQLARGAPACFLSGISGWFSLSLGAWVLKNLAR